MSKRLPVLFLLLPVCLVSVVLASENPAPGQQPKKKPDRETAVTGAANYLRALPKKFATFQSADSSTHRVTLLVEGEKKSTTWQVLPEAEIKVVGWWGRLDQFQEGDRVWAWFEVDRKRQPIAIAMLADEISQQDIHGEGVKVLEVQPASISIQPIKGKKRTLATSSPLKVQTGQRVYVQSKGKQARLVLTPKEFQAQRAKQKETLRERWIAKGLPGSVTFLHRIAGEMEVLLDHEALRWGRWLQKGDKVSLLCEDKISGVVKSVKPWRERTRIVLVVNSFEQALLKPAQRIHLKVPTPPATVDSSPFPPLRNQPTGRSARIEWFLANIYCTCKVGKNVCTGHFYTLAGCNQVKCGMPNHMRKRIGQMIDKGMTDTEIFKMLLKERGERILRPHLLP